MAERTPESKRARRLGMLRRRAEHLQRRIVENPSRNLTYDVAELGALRWALGELDPQPKSKGGAT
ncbi:hypothetical protein [Variovorax sp. PAMC26660]|uniref:hypothetical protein n=1 Tax=Variovorax sp. PAMC26660 TaxID=2762322 RepID=UPI00164DD538|nr:hypothetical protein [Variovorax sp. PAMC26660]QNK66061.1 hypothetical protein H7F35_23050 [Variovorax sp. PAMC26660]